MPFFNAPQTVDALTADGNAAGYVTVTSNANYYPGATCWLRSGGVATPKQYRITDLSGSTKIGLREILDPTNNTTHGPQYGRTPVTQWLTMDSAQICQEASTVRVELSNIAKVPLIGV